MNLQRLSMLLLMAGMIFEHPTPDFIGGTKHFCPAGMLRAGLPSWQFLLALLYKGKNDKKGVFIRQEAVLKRERECLWLEILLCCGSWWASDRRSWSCCNKRFLQSIQNKSRRWEEAGAGLCRVSWSLKSHFCVCVLQESRECGSWSLWDVCG